MHYRLYTHILGKKVNLVDFETWFLLTLCLPQIVKMYGEYVYIEPLSEAAIKHIGRLPKTAKFYIDNKLAA